MWVLGGGLLGYKGDHMSHPARQKPGNAAKMPETFGKEGVEFLKCRHTGNFVFQTFCQPVEVGGFGPEAV